MSCRTTIRISLPVERLNANPAWPFLHWLGRLLATCIRLHERQRQRQALLELDDRLLDDIGLSREQAAEAGRKPFWK